MKTVAFEGIRNLMVEINLPETVLDLYEGKCEIEPLKNHFTYPHKILDYPEYQKKYLVDRYKPFLADDYSLVIYAYDIVSGKYVKYTVERFDAESLTPMSWDSLFIDYIIMLWESEYSDSMIIEYGNLLGVKNVKRILEERIKYEETANPDYLERLEWKKSLVEYIDGIDENE